MLRMVIFQEEREGDDSATVVKSTTCVSSIVDPLIAAIGMNNLESAIKDYDNVIDTFLKYCKYFIFYKLNNNNKYIETQQEKEKLDRILRLYYRLT